VERAAEGGLYQRAPGACSRTQPRPSRSSRTQSQGGAESAAWGTQCCRGARRGGHGTPAKLMATQCLPPVTCVAAWAPAQISSLNAAFKFPPSVSSTSDPSFLSVSCFQCPSGRTKHTASSPLAIPPVTTWQSQRPNPTTLLHSLQGSSSSKGSSPFRMLSLQPAQFLPAQEPVKQPVRKGRSPKLNLPPTVARHLQEDAPIHNKYTSN